MSGTNLVLDTSIGRVTIELIGAPDLPLRSSEEEAASNKAYAGILEMAIMTLLEAEVRGPDMFREVCNILGKGIGDLLDALMVSLLLSQGPCEDPNCTSCGRPPSPQDAAEQPSLNLGGAIVLSFAEAGLPVQPQQ